MSGSIYAETLTCTRTVRPVGRGADYHGTVYELTARALTRDKAPRLVATIMLTTERGPRWATTVGSFCAPGDRPEWDWQHRQGQYQWNSFRDHSKTNAVARATKWYEEWRGKHEPTEADAERLYDEALTLVDRYRTDTLRWLATVGEDVTDGAKRIKDRHRLDDGGPDMLSLTIDVVATLDRSQEVARRHMRLADTSAAAWSRAQLLAAERRAAIGPDRAHAVEDRRTAARMAKRLRGETTS